MNIFDESIAKLAISMFVIPLPSPVIIPPTSRDSDMNTEPLKVESTPAPVLSNTLKKPSGSTDAVTEPVEIRSVSNAKLAIEILVKPLPSPIYLPPPSTEMEPDVFIEPVN